MWQADGREWNIASLWRSSDWFERLVLVALALMLAYALFVLGRFYYRSYLAHREFGALVPDSTHAFQRRQRTLLAELSLGVGTLKSIASAAPFLGLTGTCYGILDGFRGMTGTWDPLAMATASIGASLVPAVAGIIVAIPAILSYNHLRSSIERFERGLSNMPVAACVPTLSGVGRSYQFAQKLPLQSRFSNMPPFALLAAPVLASLVAIFTFFQPYEAPAGLFVRLLEVGSLENRRHPVKSAIISVDRASANGSPLIRVNFNETPVDNLDEALVRKLKLPPQWTAYVEAEDTLPWGDVVKVVDVVKGLDANVVLLTTKPNPNARGR